MSGTTTGNFSGPVSSGLAQLQTELSRINMLRVRGEFTSAKTALLGLLKQFPQSTDAHIMMGDVHTELREFARAVEWYQLATDLDKTSVVAQNKLRRAQAAYGQVSGDAATKPMVQPIALYVVAAIATVAIGSVAFIAGNKNGKAPTNTIVEKVVAPPIPMTTGNAFNNPNRGMRSAGEIDNTSRQLNYVVGTAQDAVRPESQPTAKGQVEGLRVAAGDRILQEQISARTGYQDKIVSVEENPRDRTMTITFQVSQQEHGRYIGACIAVSAIAYHMGANMVTLRGIRNGVLMYMADVQREKVMELEGAENANSLLSLQDHGWIDKVLTNEYKKTDAVANPTPSRN